MSEKNPYYLHEQNEMNVYNREQRRFQNHPAQQNNLNNNSSNDFARQDSHHNNLQLNQPPQYQPIMYIPPQQYQPIAPYQPAFQPQYYPQNQPYPNQPAPLFRQYEQSSSRNSHRSSPLFDHCPFCNQMTNSFIDQKLTWFGWLMCFLLFCFTIVLFWLPFCCSSFKERHFKCVKCRKTKYVVKNQCC